MYRSKLPVHRKMGRFIDRNIGLVFTTGLLLVANIVAFVVVFGPHL